MKVLDEALRAPLCSGLPARVASQQAGLFVTPVLPEANAASAAKATKRLVHAACTSQTAPLPLQEWPDAARSLAEWESVTELRFHLYQCSQ